ncbi:hypothetical protein BC826DRAFT_534701 [Russula brevipes]|nr:hypothetical protein BC826DRAFT_534701 [Russula brevipes]
MPFATDVNWPQGLLTIFNIGCNKNAPLESRYYGPYDSLINYAMCEGSNFKFFLAPQTTPDENFLRVSVDFVVFMVVLNQQQEPVLIVQIKDDGWAAEAGKRQTADSQMRQRFDQMLHQCAIPRLYGLSLLGTSLRVYYGDKVTGVITPEFVERPDVRRVLPLAPDFLEGQWGLDILSPEGFTKIKEIVTYIKEAANV